MPWRICDSCNRRVTWRNQRGTTAPKVCSCGGKLVHDRDHPLTVQRFLDCERKRLEWLMDPERSNIENVTNGGYYAPDRLARIIAGSKKRIAKMEAIAAKAMS